jgi:serine/threonine-protein kinase
LSPTEERLRHEGPDEPDLPDALEAGSSVGRFRVIARIGRGGMGVIYRAEDETLRREVALKVLPVFYSHDAGRRRQLLHEARAAAAVNHPNIATIYEVGEVGGRVYIAMELIEGKTLRKRLGRGRLPVEQAVGIGRQILSVLANAHAAGLIHRDLKPDNIMITDQGLAKVLDFGLAKQRVQPSARAAPRGEGDRPDSEDTLSHWTIYGVLRGTPRYMSPEQAVGHELDHRSDLFSFGVMLYEMLAGCRPFAGETIVDLLTAIALETPKPLSEVNPEVPALLSQIVAQCLAKKPEDRYPDCASLLDALERFSSGAQGSSSSPSTPEAAPPAPEAAPPAPEAAPSTPEAAPPAPDAAPPARDADGQDDPPMRRSFLGKTCLAGLLVLFGMVAAEAWHARAPPPPPPPTPAPKPTAITDLPLPISSNPGALAAYKAVLASMRDGNWGKGKADLRRAIDLDPLIAAAHLRLALTLNLEGSAAEGRASYARAVQGRATLSERDQVLLWALEPALSVDPPSETLTAERLREATERYPLDAELFFLLSYFTRSLGEASLGAARRATEIDPDYAGAFQAMGQQLTALNRVKEALSAFDQCVRCSPASIDCHGERAVLYGILGRCAAVEEDLRRAIAENPKDGITWYDVWISALYALGRPREVVLEAMAQKWAQTPEEKRRPIELFDRARLDFDAGQFAQAEARARQGSRLAQADRNDEIHARYATLLLRINGETGRAREAAKVADGYLKRKDLWNSLPNSYARIMPLLRTMLHAGALSKEAFASKRAEWTAQRPEFGKMTPGVRWFFAYGDGIERPEEAEEAIVALTQLPPGSTSSLAMHAYGAGIGKVYLLAGRIDEALPLLRPENQPCAAPGDGYTPSFYLGQALEQKGDSNGACAAYQVVLDHWGKAKPRSITAEKARERVKALGCAARNSGAAPSP